jgi:hypothetical protein
LIQTLAQGQTPASKDGQSAADGPTAHDELGSLMTSIDGVSQRIADLSRSLETRVGQRTRELEVAAHIGREIATIYEIDRLLNRAINLICDEFGYYHAQVYLVDDARVNAVLAYSRGEPGQLLLERNHKLAIGSQSIIGAVTGSGEPVIVNDTQQAGQPA